MNPVSRQFSNLGLLVRYRLETNKVASEDKIFFSPSCSQLFNNHMDNVVTMGGRSIHRSVH